MPVSNRSGRFIAMTGEPIDNRIPYPSIVLNPDDPMNQEKLLMDTVNYPWVKIGEIDDTNPLDVHRVDILTVSPAACGEANSDVKELKGNIVMYYQIEPFYQNHRLYIFSRDQIQLNGNYRKTSQLSLCAPLITVADAKSIFGEIPSWWQPPPVDLGPDKDVSLHPCGLQAISVFNDTFIPSYYDDKVVDDLYFDTSAEAITIENDRVIFKNPDPADIPLNEDGKKLSYEWLNRDIFAENIEDPKFINWMRLSVWPSTRKLVGRFSGELALPLKIIIHNRFNVSQWDGEKSIVISKQPYFGSLTEMVSLPFWLLATATLLIVIIFTVKLEVKPRRIGDSSLFGTHAKKR